MIDGENTEEMSEEERAMMEEWEAMAGGDAEDTDNATVAADATAQEFEAPTEVDIEEDDSRILDQDEIDNLLGFDDVLAGGEQSGIAALVNSALVNYEKLPMIDVVFDRLVRLMSTSLRNLTSDNVEISLDHTSSVRFGDYLNSIPLPAMLAIFKAEEWDDHGLMVVDSSLIYSIVDVLLGGRRGTSAMRVEGRPYTTIEQKLIERMVNVILSDMSASFDPLSPVSFRLERIETNPRFATITQSNNAGVLVRMRIDMGDRSGRVEIMLPYATLEPIRELLLQMFMGEKFGRDSIWEGHLTNELYLTDIEIQAILGELTLPLGEILSWKPGTTITLNTRIDDSIELRVGDFPMFMAKTGQKQGSIAVSVEEYIEPENEVIA